MGNDVYRAVDAMLVLSVDDKSTMEGTTADALVSQYDLSNTVGRLQNVTVTVTSDVRPFYELGRRYPTHLRSGNIRVSGSAERAHVNGALLRLLLGDGASSPPNSANFAQPAFNIVANLADPGKAEQFSKLVIFGVKFDHWEYRVPLDGFVMEAINFQALRISIEEA